MGRRLSAEEKKQNDALSHWFNISDETKEIASIYERDFAFILLPVRQRLLKDGYEAYADLTDADIEKALQEEKENCKKKDEANAKEGRNTHHFIDERAFKAVLILCREFSKLSSEDRQAIMGIRTFLDR